MTHDQLMATLERERVSYPDDLEAERYTPKVTERIAGRTPAYTPVTEKLAAQHRARLAHALREDT